MRSITDHLKRIRKEAVQNDFITFAWLLYSILLIIFFVGIGYEAIFYLSSSIRLFILKTILISGLIIILFVFIINVLIEQNKIKRYSWSKLARSAGKLAFPKSDVIINAFQLEKSNSTIESNSLSNSYIDGISKKLNRLNLKKLFPTRLSEFWKMINLLILSLGMIMIVLFWNSTSNAIIRWGHPYHEFEVPKPFYIEGITRNIHLLGGESSPLNFKAFGQVPDSLYLELIPSSNDTSILFIMNKDSNGLYTYEVEEVYEDYRYRAYSPAEYFWQAWDKIITPYYYISVTDRPIMEEFTIKISPPDYSGLPISIQKANQSDVNALIGTSIRIDLKSNRKLKNGYLSLNKQKTPLKIKGKRAAGGFIFKEDALLTILLEDHRGITNQNPIPYHLQIIPDLKPEMSIIQPQPLLELGTEQLIPIQIKIEDDFGFSTLQIGYEIKRPSYIENQSQISIFPIYISDPKVLSQEIKSIWKLNEYNLMPEDEVHYHFELYDNDKVSGPKKSISNTYIARLPSLGDLFASIEEKNSAGAVTEYVHNRPATMYGCNKLYCEHLGRYYAHSYRQLASDSALDTSGNRGVVDFRCVRYPGLISTDTVPTGGTSDYVPEMLHAAARGEHYNCFVREDSRIPFMTMPEAIQATLQLAAAPRNELTSIVYNIASFSPTPGEVASLVSRYFSGAEISFEPDERRQAIVDTWPESLDCSAAERDWGFTPTYTLEQAFEDYLIPRITTQYESVS